MWPFRKKTPPQTVVQEALASPGTRFNPSWQFTYEAKRLPGPGTNNYAYENLGLVEFSPIGDAVSNRMFLRPTQPPADNVGQALWLQGLGGLAQGTIYGQPLISPQGAWEASTAAQIHS